MSTPGYKYEWTDVSLDDVLKFFATGFELKDGSTLVEHKAFVDTAKNRVVLRLTVQAPEGT